MGRRRRSASRRSTRYERKIEHRQWFTSSGFAEQTVTLKAGADTDNVVKIAVDQLKGDDQTILRTRGIVAVATSALGSDTIAVLGGIVLPNKTASNASTDELPSPLVDADTTDWFVWHPFMIPSSIADSGDETPADAVITEPNQMHVDSKAKRIMEASESVVWLLGLNPKAAVSGKQFNVAYNLRTLVGY